MPRDTTHLAHGMDQLLPWLFIADDNCSVICNKDSSLMASWNYTGVDIESGHLELIDQVSMALDEIWRGFADYQPLIWTRVDRRAFPEYSYGKFSNPIAEEIDKAWAHTFVGEENEVFLNEHYITVAMPVVGGALSLGELTRSNLDSGMTAPKALFEALRNKFVGGQKRFGFTNRQELDSMLKRFEQVIASSISNSSTGLEVKRLIGEELLAFLKSTASASRQDIVAIDHFKYLDTYLSDSFIDTRHADYLTLEGKEKKYVACYSLKKAPSNEQEQFFRDVMALPVNLSICSCWKAVSNSDAQKFLNDTRTFDELRMMEWKKLLRNATRRDYDISGDSAPSTEVGIAAMELKHEVKQRRAACGWLATSVIVYAKNLQELREECDLVERALESCGLVFVREREGDLSAFCTGIPGQTTEPVRWHFVEAANVTDTMPIITMLSGDNKHPFFSEGQDATLPPNAVFKTRYRTPYYFNYHKGQLGHTLLVGPSRNGKTMLQMFLESQFLKYPNARIFNIDKDYSLKPQTYLLDGEYFDLDPGKGGLKMNPVALVKDDMGKAWLVGWLDRLMSNRGTRPSDKEINEISNAVNRIAGVPGARLTSLMSQLPESLRVRLAPWCQGGTWGAYFDNVEDHFSLSTITTTEVGGLINAGLIDVVNAYADYAFYRIERALMNREQEEIGPTMVYFEEAGFLLDDEIFANKARDYLMTLAKKKAFLVMTAQSPEPFANNEKLGAAVRDNVATVIFMPNAQAIRDDLGGKYKKAFGVNDNHLALIASARSRAEYCIFHPQTGEFRVVEAQFPPGVVAALRSDVQTQALFNRVYSPENPSWKEKYLQLARSV